MAYTHALLTHGPYYLESKVFLHFGGFCTTSQGGPAEGSCTIEKDTAGLF